MADGPTREELRRLYETIDSGFKSLMLRLDDFERRSTGLEVAHENVRTRLTSVEHELFKTPRRRHEDAAGEGERWSLAFSKREGLLIGFGLVVIEVLLKILETVGTQFWNVLMHKA